MRPLYSVAEIRELEARAVREAGVSGAELMRRAAEATLEQLLLAWPKTNRLVIICGAGNNGGDGYLLAVLGLAAGLRTLVVEAGGRAPSGEAARAKDLAIESGVLLLREAPLGSRETPPKTLVVDALLGIGFRGALRAPAADWINWMNASPWPVVALDVPSGLDADTGRPAKKCVRAAMTVTFIADKRGFHTRGAADFTGQLQLAGLGLPKDIYETPKTLLPAWDRERHVLRRPAEGHKGRYGHVLVLGGDAGMGGALLLAAEAALRAGAGLVSVAGRPEHCAPLLCRRPEAMYHALASGAELRDFIGSYRYLVLGPGLGMSAWSKRVYEEVVRAAEERGDLQLVLDADALNLLAAGGAMPRANCILTPHPGEAARLLACRVEEVQADRFAAAIALQEKHGATILLKGAGSLLAGRESGGCRIHVCPYGNPGMSGAGMGDLLAGLLGGLIAQGLDARRAGIIGMLAHSAAADLAARELGRVGLAAADLLPFVAKLLGGVLEP